MGKANLHGCNACGACGKNKDERCIIEDDLNDWIQRMKRADAIIIGSPTYFGGMSARPRPSSTGPGTCPEATAHVSPQGRGGRGR